MQCCRQVIPKSPFMISAALTLLWILSFTNEVHSVGYANTYNIFPVLIDVIDIQRQNFFLLPLAQAPICISSLKYFHELPHCQLAGNTEVKIINFSCYGIDVCFSQLVEADWLPSAHKSPIHALMLHICSICLDLLQVQDGPFWLVLLNLAMIVEF